MTPPQKRAKAAAGRRGLPTALATISLAAILATLVSTIGSRLLVSVLDTVPEFLPGSVAQNRRSGRTGLVCAQRGAGWRSRQSPPGWPGRRDLAYSYAGGIQYVLRGCVAGPVVLAAYDQSDDARRFAGWQRRELVKTPAR